MCALDRSMTHAAAPIEVCVSSERPPTIEGRRWLPAPGGSFSLAMSFYQPLRALRDGSWRLPAVERVTAPARTQPDARSPDVRSQKPEARNQNYSTPTGGEIH
jgi:hypothetical protein